MSQIRVCAVERGGRERPMTSNCQRTLLFTADLLLFATLHACFADRALGDAGATKLADGLRTNSTLQTLRLQSAYGGRGGGRGVGRGGSGRDGEVCMWRGELVSVGACGFGEEGEGGGLSCVRGQLIF